MEVKARSVDAIVIRVERIEGRLVGVVESDGKYETFASAPDVIEITDGPLGIVTRRMVRSGWSSDSNTICYVERDGATVIARPRS